MEPQFEVLPPQRPLPPPKPKRGGLIGALIAMGAVALKFMTPLLVLLKTGGTMLLSVGAYCFAFGWSWQLAGGVVVLVLVHEMGHFVSAKYYRVSVTAPMFIPLVGAYVLLKNRPMNPWINGMISYAGPLAGGLGGWACYGLGLALGWPWLFVVAFYTFILNLFNLLPIPPLDGSHIWIAFSPSRTPTMAFAERGYMAIFLAALIAGLVLGMLDCWPYIQHMQQ
jgi:Zn-dependent protease